MARLLKVEKQIQRVELAVVSIASISPRQQRRFNKKVKEYAKIMNGRLYCNLQDTFYEMELQTDLENHQ